MRAAHLSALPINSVCTILTNTHVVLLKISLEQSLLQVQSRPSNGYIPEHQAEGITQDEYDEGMDEDDKVIFVRPSRVAVAE